MLASLHRPPNQCKKLELASETNGEQVREICQLSNAKTAEEQKFLIAGTVVVTVDPKTNPGYQVKITKVDFVDLEQVTVREKEEFSEDCSSVIMTTFRRMLGFPE